MHHRLIGALALFGVVPVLAFGLLALLLDAAQGLRWLMIALSIAAAATTAAFWWGRRLCRPLCAALGSLATRLDGLALNTARLPPSISSDFAELARVEDAFIDMSARVGRAWSRQQEDLLAEERLREELARSIAQRQTMESELAIAREIQMSMVPSATSLAAKSPNLDLAAVLEPARAVGGDFYDVIASDDQYTCFYIGDVSDKGVAAALFMARVSTFLEVSARRGEPPGKLLSQVARQIARDNPSEMFATVLCGVIDVGVGTVSFASAGHDPPLILRADGRVESIPLDTGPAIGFEAESEYPEWHLRLKPGDTVLCYTDGLSEAADANGVEFGAEGATAVLTDSPGADAKTIMLQLGRAVRRHTGGMPPHDDLTVLCVRRRPAVRQALSAKPPIVFDMPNRLAVLPVLTAALDDALLAEQVPERVRLDITLILEEVLTNTVSYGYAEGVRDTIHLHAFRDGDRLYLAFDDGGAAWNPLAHKLPDLEAPIEDRDTGGLGVLLVRELSESAKYERLDSRNHLSLVMRLDVEREVTA